MTSDSLDLTTIHPPTRVERWRWLVVAIAGAAALFPTLSPDIIGTFHDDAIYASGARLLAEGGSYLLPNLPDAPYQTKYPPFLSVLLAVVWWIRPEFPGNILLLKALNLGFVAAAVYGIAALARAANPRLSWTVPVGCQLVLVTSPLVVGFVDYTMSDVLFTTLVTLSILLWGPSGAPTSRRREGAVLLVAAVAILSRSVGIALTVAIAIDCLLRGRRSRAALHAGVGFAVLAAWMLWASMHRAGGSPLLAYYQEYERPALAYLTTDPRLVVQIVVGNIRLIVDSMFKVMGPVWILIWPGLIPLLVTGAVQLVRSGWRMPFLFAGCYLALVVAHPFMPDRYLLPLVPLCILAAAVGATHLWAVVQRSRDAVRRPASVPALIVLGVLLFGNGIWLQFQFRPNGNVQGWTGIDMGYRWSGFQETFEWIRGNTQPEARLGSLFDTMYFLYTDRQAVQPWVHRPETFFYPYRAAKPFVGKPEDVVQELRALRIDYLVFDPPSGFVEGPAAMALMRRLVVLPEVNAVLVFTSRDGLHQVYRLWNADDQRTAHGPSRGET